jgi:hypothetical protein
VGCKANLVATYPLPRMFGRLSLCKAEGEGEGCLPLRSSGAGPSHLSPFPLVRGRGGQTTRMVQCEPESQFSLCYISSGGIIGAWLNMFTKRLR